MSSLKQFKIICLIYASTFAMDTFAAEQATVLSATPVYQLVNATHQVCGYAQVLGQQNSAQTVQTCSPQVVQETQLSYYDVQYEFAGKQYAVQMPYDPGPTLLVEVTPQIATVTSNALAIQPTTVVTTTSFPVTVVYPYGYPYVYNPHPFAFSLGVGYWGGYRSGYRGGYRYR